VEGNPEHCINLLQLVHEISVMMAPEGEEGGDGADEPGQPMQDSE
jgi:hypothetical protein